MLLIAEIRNHILAIPSKDTSRWKPSRKSFIAEISFAVGLKKIKKSLSQNDERSCT